MPSYSKPKRERKLSGASPHTLVLPPSMAGHAHIAPIEKEQLHGIVRGTFKVRLEPEQALTARAVTVNSACRPVATISGVSSSPPRWRDPHPPRAPGRAASCRRCNGSARTPAPAGARTSLLAPKWSTVRRTRAGPAARNAFHAPSCSSSGPISGEKNSPQTLWRGRRDFSMIRTRVSCAPWRRAASAAAEPAGPPPRM